MKCELCEWEQPDDVAGIEAGIDHLRVIHPEQYGNGPERWPDGGLVIEDTTLDPDDFGDPA